jgi:hypothetical protein
MESAQRNYVKTHFGAARMGATSVYIFSSASRQIKFCALVSQLQISNSPMKRALATRAIILSDCLMAKNKCN